MTSKKFRHRNGAQGWVFVLNPIYLYDVLAISRLHDVHRSQLNKKLSLDANSAFLTITSASLLCQFKLRVRDNR